MNEININTSDGIMNIRVLDITPEYAEEILKLNTFNRRIKRKRVETYAADMSNNQWKSNGVPIIIGNDNVLKDGQHRLMACIKSKTTLRNTILIHIPEGQSSCYDIGCTRTTADTAVLMGKNEAIFKSPKAISALKAAIDIEFPGAGTLMSKSLLIQEAEQNVSGLSFIHNYIGNGNRIKGIAVAGVWGAILNAYNCGYPYDKLVKFCNVLVSGMADNKEDFPIIALRNYLLSNDSTKREHVKDKFMRTQNALYKYEKGVIADKCYSSKNIYYRYNASKLSILKNS